MIEPFKKLTLTRLKKIRGQIDGIIKMVEEGKYCIDILTQCRALQGGIKGGSEQILESHLNSCSAKHLASNNKEKKQKFIKELVKVISISSR